MRRMRHFSRSWRSPSSLRVKGAIRRLVQQGGVKIDGEKQDDPSRSITPPVGEQIFQAGKRVFFKLVG
jgi:tyrosyl-tRNA synthetase